MNGQAIGGESAGDQEVEKKQDRKISITKKSNQEEKLREEGFGEGSRLQY